MGLEYDSDGRRVSINIWYPELPPSTNKIYFRGTRLRRPAVEYRERFRQYVQQHFGHQLQEMPEPNEWGMRLVKRGKKEEYLNVSIKTIQPNLIFGLNLFFYMDCLTESWHNMTIRSSKRAAFRFQKVDLTNRIKFVEDCVKYSMAIDDSLTFVSTQMKIHEPTNQGVMIQYYIEDPRRFGVPIVLSV